MNPFFKGARVALQIVGRLQICSETGKLHPKLHYKCLSGGFKYPCPVCGIMADTDWQEGKQLKDGRPDVDYVGAHIQVYLDHQGWVCQIRWGTTWGHLAFGKGSDTSEAIGMAVEQASANGCPAQWLPTEFW